MKTVRPLLAATLIALCSFARADVPRTIAFQGTLKDAAGTPLSGPRSVTFTLYDAATEGNALWTETQSVTPTNGLFAAPLGSVTPLTLPFDKPYWVGIKVADDTEMTPRVPLASAPYALALPGFVVNSTERTGLGGPPTGERLTLYGVKNTTTPDDALNSEWLMLANPVTQKQWHINGRGSGINFVETNVADYRLYLAAGGDVGIGTDAPSARLHVIGQAYIDPTAWGYAPTVTLAIGDNDTGINWAGDGQLDVYSNAVNMLQIRNGSISVNGNVRATTLTLTSSRRYKRDVQPLTNALGTLSQLQGVSYVWDQQHGGKPDIGFIAEDAGKVVPELVTWGPNGVDAVGMDYSHLTALTVEGIKEQQAEIASLKAANAAKDTRIADLEARLARLERLVEGKR